jgi:hypothetical protein
VRKIIFSFVLIVSAANAATLQDADSIKNVPEDSVLAFDPRFVLMANADSTTVGQVKDQHKMCFFKHQINGRQRTLPAQLRVLKIKFESGVYDNVNGSYITSVEFVFGKENELSLVCKYPGDTIFSMQELRDLLSTQGGTLTPSEPVDF